MCGIFGIISKDNRDDLGVVIAKALYQMQNRGNFSAGIGTIWKLPMNRQEYRRARLIAPEETYKDFVPIHIRKGLGLVNQVIRKKDLEKLRGFMGIGQVRYPTAGYAMTAEQKALPEEEKRDLAEKSAQPLYTELGKIVMVHNGDIHNHNELMEYFKGLGIRKASVNDLESLMNVFSEEFFDISEYVANDSRLERTLSRVFERVKGTYSTIALINNVGLVAFRDPEGRRPLHFGVRKDTEGNITDYAFASETVALNKRHFKGTSNIVGINGRPSYEEVAPGEMVFISKDFQVFRKQLVPSNPKPCPFEGSYFARGASFINNRRVKTEIRSSLIDSMWQRFKEGPYYESILADEDNVIICPVPRTAESAAEYLSIKTGFPKVTAIEKTPYSSRIFQEPTQEDRDDKTIEEHFVYEEQIKGKTVILIDDSIVRGTTMRKDVQYLKDLGVKSLHLMITFPPIRHPCMHAIDFHTHEELIAYGKTEDEIKQNLGLGRGDSLTFVVPEEMANANNYKKMCDECYRK